MKPERIGSRSKEVPGWTLETNEQAIVRNFHFTSFGEALCFIADVAEVSDRVAHYPTIEMRVTQVKLRLTTPSADALTDLDFDLAKIFDQLADELADCDEPAMDDASGEEV